MFGYDLRVIEPDGRTRPFGVPTEGLGGFTTDGPRVLWWANDCLLTADVSERTTDAIGPGVCPRSEVRFPGDPPTSRCGERCRCPCNASPRQAPAAEP